MRFCPFCSAENSDELAVCQACGRRLPPLPPRRRNAPGTGVQLPPRAAPQAPPRRPGPTQAPGAGDRLDVPGGRIGAAGAPAVVPAGDAMDTAPTPVVEGQGNRIAPLADPSAVAPRGPIGVGTVTGMQVGPGPSEPGLEPLTEAEVLNAIGGDAVQPPVRARTAAPGPTVPMVSTEPVAPTLRAPTAAPLAPDRSAIGTGEEPPVVTSTTQTVAGFAPIAAGGLRAPAPPPGSPRETAPGVGPPPSAKDTAPGVGPALGLPADDAARSLANALSPGPAAQRREPAPPDADPSGAGRRRADATQVPRTIPSVVPGRAGATTNPPPLRADATSAPPRAGSTTSPPPLRADATTNPPLRADATTNPPPLRAGSTSAPPRADATTNPPPLRADATTNPPPLRAGSTTSPPPLRAGSTTSPPPLASNGPSAAVPVPPPLASAPLASAPAAPPLAGPLPPAAAPALPPTDYPRVPAGFHRDFDTPPSAVAIVPTADGREPPPTRIHRPEALVDRPFTPPKVNQIPEVPEPGLLSSARYTLRFAKARWQRRGAIRLLGADIKQDTDALDQVLGALGAAARTAKLDGRVFSGENAAITAAEDRAAQMTREHNDVDTRKLDENSKFVEVERERNTKLAEAERMVDEAQKELAGLEAQRKSLRETRKEHERRQKTYLKAAEDNEKQAGATEAPEQRADLRRAAEQHRREAAALEPERQELDRRLAAIERPISEATARLDAAKAELDAAKRSLADAREGHTHRLAELDAEQKRKAREIAAAEAEIARRLVTLGTLVNLNRIDDPQYEELYQRIDRLRGAITARTTEIEKLTAEREAYDRGHLVRGVATIGGAILLFIALIVILRAVLLR
jgi:hypothetical protein